MGKRAFRLLITFISYIVLMIIGHLFLKPAGIDRVEVLGEGWEVRRNDTEYSDVRLADLRRLIGDGAKSGDMIVLSKENVDLGSYSCPTVMFETRFSAWKLTYDGKEITQEHFNSFEDEDFIGCENNFVTIPVSDKPSELRIELKVAEDGAYNYYESPVVGDYVDVLQYSVYNNLFVFMTSAFLVIFGLVFFVIALRFKSDLPEINMQMYSALLFIMLGIYFLTQFKLLDLFMDTREHQTEIEYISLYLLVPIMYMVMGCMHNYLKKKVFLVLWASGTIIAVAPIILHYTGVVHINQMLTVFQGNATVLFAFMIVMLIKDTRAKKITVSQAIQLTGQITLALSFIFNVIFYYLEVLGVMEQIMLSKIAVPMGTMCMVFATVLNYQVYISESYARKKEHESLAHLAYADGLTGIANRSKYEKYLNGISEAEGDYCVVSIDLNGLKTVNDRDGHLMGDKYLSEFSTVLAESFGRKGFIARIGGDEFVAILVGENMSLVDNLIGEMNRALEDLNHKDPSIKRSAAAGYAFRHEVDGTDWNSVYLRADDRMYKNKTEMKKAITGA